MVVETLDRIPGNTGLMGLYIGASNVRDYFPPGTEMIELELDHLRIACYLDPSFWDGRPEIHDIRLSSWLEAKRRSGKLSSTPAVMAMIPCGERLFRLNVIVKDESDHALGHQPGAASMAYVSPMPSSLAAVDRRKRSLDHQPERRKASRLRNNEHPAPPASH